MDTNATGMGFVADGITESDDNDGENGGHRSLAGMPWARARELGHDYCLSLRPIWPYRVGMSRVRGLPLIHGATDQ